jgi:hypothetical protein
VGDWLRGLLVNREEAGWDVLEQESKDSMPQCSRKKVALRKAICGVRKNLYTAIMTVAQFGRADGVLQDCAGKERTSQITIPECELNSEASCHFTSLID